jgi:hypothetical protein
MLPNNTPEDPDLLLKEEDAGHLLNLSVRTLQAWRVRVVGRFVTADAILSLGSTQIRLDRGAGNDGFPTLVKKSSLEAHRAFAVRRSGTAWPLCADRA